MFKPSLGKCNQKSLGQGLGIWCLWWALCCGFHLFWGGGFILLWISIGHVVLQTAAKSSHSTCLNFGSGFTSEYKPWEVSPCYPKFMDLHHEFECRCLWVSGLHGKKNPFLSDLCHFPGCFMRSTRHLLLLSLSPGNREHAISTISSLSSPACHLPFGSTPASQQCPYGPICWVTRYYQIRVVY